MLQRKQALLSLLRPNEERLELEQRESSEIHIQARRLSRSRLQRKVTQSSAFTPSLTIRRESTEPTPSPRFCLRAARAKSSLENTIKISSSANANSQSL